MEINYENFSRSTEMMRKAIMAADFIAVDTEFSGLNEHLRVKFDLPDLFYRRLIHSAFQPVIFQFGFSAFRYDEQSRSYAVQTFSTYVRPDVTDSNFNLLSGSGFEAFLCQPNAMDFLWKYGFSFNSWFDKGVPFTRADVYDKVVRHQNVLHRKRYLEECELSNDDRKVLENILGNEIAATENFMKYSRLKIFEISTKEPMNFRNWLRAAYGKKVFITWEKHRKKQNVTLIKCKDDEEYLALAEQMRINMIRDKCELGFTEILLLLSNSKKPIIGHNIYMDIYFAVHWFFRRLPNDWTEYKRLIRELFPNLYDTKCIASDKRFSMIRGTALPVLFRSLCQMDTPVAFYSDFNNKYVVDIRFRKHEAGHDAVMTGQVFAYLCYLLKYDYGRKMPPNGNIQIRWDKLEEYRLQVFMPSMVDIKQLDFKVDEDKIPDRSAVVVVHTTDPPFVEADIRMKFAKMGYAVLRFYRQNQSCLFVVFPDDVDAERLVESINGNRKDWNDFSVYSYAQFERDETLKSIVP